MNKKAFTLIELLVVVLIIGILAGIALPKYRKAVAKAELAQLLSVIKSFTNSLQSYYLANNIFPTQTTINSLDISISEGNTICRLEGGPENHVFLHCSNKNFAIWTSVLPNVARVTIIGTNAVAENHALSYAAKEFFGQGLTRCRKDDGKSSTCVRLNLESTGCFVCDGTKYI